MRCFDLLQALVEAMDGALSAAALARRIDERRLAAVVESVLSEAARAHGGQWRTRLRGRQRDAILGEVAAEIARATEGTNTASVRLAQDLAIAEHEVDRGVDDELLALDWRTGAASRSRHVPLTTHDVRPLLDLRIHGQRDEPQYVRAPRVALMLIVAWERKREDAARELEGLPPLRRRPINPESHECAAARKRLQLRHPHRHAARG